MKKVKIFTDGCCKGNPGPGGYGCVLKFQDQVKDITGASRNTTNNIMEMTACITALEYLREPYEVQLTTDSQYVIMGITKWIYSWLKKNWVNSSRQPVKNKELWQRLYALNQKHKVSWCWVKGHAGHPENERCDQLANQALISI